MNSFISVFKQKILPRLMIALAVITLLFLFDRLAYLGLARLANGFYAGAQVGKDWYGQTEMLGPGFYDCFISGTSRTKEAVMPLHLYRGLGLKALNTASPGRYPRYHYHHYLKLRELNAPPKIYIYGVDYFTFGKESNEKQLQALLGGKKDLKSWDIRSMNNPSSNFWSRVSRVYRAKREIDAFWVDLLDYLSFRWPWSGKTELNPDWISWYQGLYGAVPAENLIEPASWNKAPYDAWPGVEGDYFLKLLEALRRDRVLVVLLLIPDFITVHQTNHEHDKQLADLLAFEKRFPNVYLLSYNDRQKFELDNRSFFTDGRYGERISHLSAFGAERLSQLLSADIPELQKTWRNRRSRGGY